MANIKISELDELQKATDQDLLVIVDVANNETKKIQAGNLGTGGAEIPIGSTPPENPKEGDFWIDTSANGETYGDTLPIGAMVEYNGTTIPNGYEEVDETTVNLKTSIIHQVTPNGATNYAFYGGTFYYKNGSRVHVHIGIKLTSNTTTNIFTLPVGYRPYTIIGAVGLGEDINSTSGVQVTLDGSVKVNTQDFYALIDIEFDTFES